MKHFKFNPFLNYVEKNKITVVVPPMVVAKVISPVTDEVQNLRFVEAALVRAASLDAAIKARCQTLLSPESPC
jgi:hypothetical protein